jgi:hypothetical protein
MNKITFLLQLSLLASLMSMAQPSPADVSIVIKKGAVNMGKKNNVAGDWTLTKAVKYLGTSARIRDGYNRTHTYDEIGVVLFESTNNKVPSGNISEIQVHFSMPERNDVVPSSGFTGSLTVDKLSINSSTTLASIRKKLKGYSESKSYIDHSYRLAKNGIYFYFQFDASETRLVKVSFGKDMRN